MYSTSKQYMLFNTYFHQYANILYKTFGVISQHWGCFSVIPNLLSGSHTGGLFKIMRLQMYQAASD